MNYEITHNRLMDVMKKYMEKNMPEIELPLVKRKSTGKGNRGYGSGLDDYFYTNLYYYSQNDVGFEKPIFIEWSDNHLYSDEKWSVYEGFEPMYNIFGEENFEKFIKWCFGFDITKYGNKRSNWVLE
jgi:hypothetical protein